MEARPAHPYAYQSIRPTADQNTGATNGTFTTLTFATAVSNFQNGIIDNPTTARLRALLAGYYRITYSLSFFNTGNATQRGMEAKITLNGTTDVADSRASGSATNSQAQSGQIMTNAVVLLAANDYAEVLAAPLSATAMTVEALYSHFRLELIRLT